MNTNHLEKIADMTLAVRDFLREHSDVARPSGSNCTRGGISTPGVTR